MNKLILIFILIAIIVIGVFLFSFSENKSLPESKPIYETGFTFYDVEQIQSTLALQNISMSSPTAVTDHTVNQYCMYFDGDVKKTVEYCTTTSILNPDGVSFGNINMGGTVDGPIMALAIIDTADVYSSKNEVDFVFQTMIETLVCDCWAEKQPGGFGTVSEWIDMAIIKHSQSSNSAPLKSQINGLNDMNLTLEIDSKDGKYLWTLIILK
ncbi:MAG: hypothetical protein HOK63_07840 [Thaumarchaeota archaeon]|jgi:hypothetical protein|nr:hypothetical protein [Nitrososphaerota archaeon]MBT5842913.1 hypothetical protein [Nitrososphaerota archaeon]MBT6469530.1 hypothetical protein [Nitrososphaerota archaeon]